MRSLQFGRTVKRGLIVAAISASLPVAVFAEPVVEEQSVQPAPARGLVVMRDAMLREHNEPRQAQGRAPLIWDDALAQDAKKWADHLAQRRIFEHAAPMPGDAAQGENLWMGTREAYSFAEMAGLWLDEGRDARSGIFPSISKTGDWRDIGHFTQMLWPGTKRVGCALASNAEDDVLVCRYYPAGNRIGDQFSLNAGR